MSFDKDDNRYETYDYALGHWIYPNGTGILQKHQDCQTYKPRQPKEKSKIEQLKEKQSQLNSLPNLKNSLEIKRKLLILIQELKQITFTP